MFVVLVYAHVKDDAIDAFREASIENATASRQEPGVVRFDVIQQADDHTQFLLIEIYRTEDDPAQHKKSSHYLRWRDIVAPLMAEPRRAVRYAIISPDEASWG
jgi:autoinducer 2-degrading protein